jgi:hypothetical protein
MTRLLRLTAVFLVSAPLLLAAGCKQGKGERCQVASDCDDGLSCVIPAGATPQSGGTCQVSGGTDMSGVVDMAAPPGADLSSTDMAHTGME